MDHFEKARALMAERMKEPGAHDQLLSFARGATSPDEIKAVASLALTKFLWQAYTRLLRDMRNHLLKYGNDYRDDHHREFEQFIRRLERSNEELVDAFCKLLSQIPAMRNFENISKMEEELSETALNIAKEVDAEAKLQTGNVDPTVEAKANEAMRRAGGVAFLAVTLADPLQQIHDIAHQSGGCSKQVEDNLCALCDNVSQMHVKTVAIMCEQAEVDPKEADRLMGKMKELIDHEKEQLMLEAAQRGEMGEVMQESLRGGMAAVDAIRSRKGKEH